MEEINNSQNIIDSRDIIERIKELECILSEVWGDNPDLWLEKNSENIASDYYDEAKEFVELKNLESEASEHSDWKDGQTLIRDSYLSDYAKEFAIDIGAIPDPNNWPINHIDWESAVDELKNDFVEVYFAEEAYWIRAS